MYKNKILISAAVVCIAGLFAFGFLNKTEKPESVKKAYTSEKQQKQAISENNLSDINSEAELISDKKMLKTKSKEANKIASDKSEEHSIVKTNLYNDTPSSVIPLSAITEMSSLPKNVQDIILNISKNSNIYMIQKQKDRLLIISDNPENIRQGIEFTEVSVSNGHQVRTTLGYNDKMQDSLNDIWEYNQQTQQPTRHTKYNANGDMDFVEVWNYDAENPIKYEMKDSEGKVISLRKETLNNGTDLRIEHLLYDKDGNTKVNVSATYEGEDIKRFTYFNADKTDEGGSIFSDYSDGQKTKETVYTSDLRVKNTYTSDYKDGNRENIIIFDNKNREIKKYLPPDKL